MCIWKNVTHLQFNVRSQYLHCIQPDSVHGTFMHRENSTLTWNQSLEEQVQISELVSLFILM